MAGQMGGGAHYHQGAPAYRSGRCNLGESMVRIADSMLVRQRRSSGNLKFGFQQASIGNALDEVAVLHISSLQVHSCR